MSEIECPNPHIFALLVDIGAVEYHSSFAVGVNLHVAPLINVINEFKLSRDVVTWKLLAGW